MRKVHGDTNFAFFAPLCAIFFGCGCSVPRLVLEAAFANMHPWLRVTVYPAADDPAHKHAMIARGPHSHDPAMQYSMGAGQDRSEAWLALDRTIRDRQIA